jgi:RNA polymerase sigma-70 factor (ECF subfamily)
LSETWLSIDYVHRMANNRLTRDDLYREAADTCGASLGRLARAYEADPDKRRDLLQEIHVALWRSLEYFEGRCSLKTWVYRIAHNTATSVVIRRKLKAPIFVGLDEIESSLREEREDSLDQKQTLDRVWSLIQKLKPSDKQVMLLYLEGMDAAAIGEITGSSPSNVATKIHRIKRLLSRKFHQGDRNAG